MYIYIYTNTHQTAAAAESTRLTQKPDPIQQTQKKNDPISFEFSVFHTAEAVVYSRKSVLELPRTLALLLLLSLVIHSYWLMLSVNRFFRATTAAVPGSSLSLQVSISAKFLAVNSQH